jgi:hypothetical protein
MSKFINRWVLAPLGVLLLLVTFFFPALVPFNADHITSAFADDNGPFKGPFAEGQHQRFVANQAHPAFVVDSIKVDDIEGSSAKVSFTLRAFGEPTVYPALLVHVFNSTTGARRPVLMTAANYQHASMPGNERAHLVVPMTAGESALTITPAARPLWPWSAAMANSTATGVTAKP